MSKLTNSTREAIARAAIAFAFDPKEKALAKAEDALAREAHALLFPKKIIDAAKSLPAGWTRKISSLNYNVGGQKIELKASESLHVPALDKSNNDAGRSYYIVGAIQPGDLCDRIQGHAQTKEKLRDEKKIAQRQIEAMLAKVTTVKKLAEAWPEGEPFYSKYLDQPAPQVPALRVDEINAMLGLPDEAETA